MKWIAGLSILLYMSVATVAGAVTKAEIKDVSGELICYCGCEVKVVATCGCGTADRIEADIGRQLEAGKTKDEIIAAYVAEHGEKGLATPIPTGFNLTAWLMPIFALLAGGFVIRTAVVRWRRQGLESQAERDYIAQKPHASGIKHKDRILKELEELD